MKVQVLAAAVAALTASTLAIPLKKSVSKLIELEMNPSNGNETMGAEKRTADADVAAHYRPSWHQGGQIGDGSYDHSWDQDGEQMEDGGYGQTWNQGGRQTDNGGYGHSWDQYGGQTDDGANTWPKH